MTWQLLLIGKVSVVVGAALLAVAAFRRRSAALRHWLLVAAIACAAAAPLVAPLAPAWNLNDANAGSLAGPPVAVTIGLDLPSGSSMRAASAATADRPRSASLSVSAVLGAVWIAGALACLGGLGLGLGRLWQIAAHGTPIAAGSWREELDLALRDFGIQRPVRLLHTSQLSLLVTWGVLRPDILLPAGALDWPAERIRIVLCHELAHIARRDWLAQMLAETLRSFYWFNPLVWLAAARLREEGEHACDDAVLGRGIDASTYARHLLDLARTAAASRRLSLPAQAMLRASTLERRITAMLNARTNRAPVSRLTRLAAAAAFGAATIALAGFGPRAQEQTVLSGTTVDTGGRAIPGASIALTSATDGSKHEVTGDRSGQFQFVALPSGGYTLDVVVPGFAPLHQPVTLNGPAMQQTLTLAIAHVEESVRVTELPHLLPAPPPDRANRLRDLRERMAARCAQMPQNACLEPPLKVKDVKPVFPPSLAGSTVEVAVRMHAVIGVDGAVHSLAVSSTDVAPEVAAAAMNAVSQWQFDPTRLDGQPVETGMDITVRFAPGK